MFFASTSCPGSGESTVDIRPLIKASLLETPIPAKNSRTMATSTPPATPHLSRLYRAKTALNRLITHASLTLIQRDDAGFLKGMHVDEETYHRVWQIRRHAQVIATQGVQGED